VIAVSVVVGFLLGGGGLGVVDLDPGSDLVGTLATFALVVILFRDGIEVEQEMLQRSWRLPFRKLVLAMPITCVLVACATHALTDLGWTESFLVGALLSPTDPVLSSSVVTNPRVPAVVRHSLNLESGLNDGLALPAVLAFAASLDPGESGFVWWKFVLQDVSVGFATGLVVGLLAARLVPRREPLLALAAAFAAYGLAVLPPHGNGLIATFVCAIALGVRRPDIRARFELRAEGVMALVKIGVFLVFGTLLTLGGLFGDGLAAVAIAVFTLLLARPIAVFAALAGTRTDLATRGFMAWFGPKGVATMTFSLLVLSQGIAAGDRVYNIASLTVLISILAHGLTDQAGSEWIARHAERVRARGSPVAA
jgi:NhaP-type Na+/H+ or K+/H+ antiporter